MNQAMLLAVVAFIYCSSIVFAQENGDVRLVDGGSARRGRVELFFNGRWGTMEVEGSFFSNGRNRRRWAADCICRQLGFHDSSDRGDVGDLSISPAASSVPRVIEDVFCGELSTTTDSEGNTDTEEVDSNHLHILRCDYDIASQRSSPDHDEDFAIECNLADDEGYDTEVQLVQGNTGFTSSGFVEIWLDDSWEPVCNMEADDADSACRQLGWTNAANFGSSSAYVGDTGRVNEFFCTSSHRCLRDCFDHPSETDVANCTEHSFINCTFVVEDEGRFNSGTPNVCSGLNVIIGIAVGVTFAAIILIGLVVTGCVFLFCFCKSAGGCGCDISCNFDCCKPRTRGHVTTVSYNEVEEKETFDPDPEPNPDPDPPNPDFNPDPDPDPPNPDFNPDPDPGPWNPDAPPPYPDFDPDPDPGPWKS